jgi:hypothetical protein
MSAVMYDTIRRRTPGTAVKEVTEHRTAGRWLGLIQCQAPACAWTGLALFPDRPENFVDCPACSDKSAIPTDLA